MKDSKTIFRLIKYFKKRESLLLLIIILIIFNTFSSIYGTYMIKGIIEEGIINQNSNYLFSNLTILTILYSLSFLSKFIYTQTMIRLSQVTIYNIRKDLYKKTLSLKIEYFSSHQIGEIIGLSTTNLDSTISSLNNSFTNLVSSFFTIIFTLIFMFILNYIISFISLFILILTIVFIFINSKKIKYYHKCHHETMLKINSLITQDLRGIKENKTYSHFDKSFISFNKINKEWKEDATNEFFRVQFNTPFIVSLSYLNFSICSIFGFFLIIYNSLGINGVATLTPLLMYVRQSASPFNIFQTHLNSILSSIEGLKKIFNFLDLDEEKDIDKGKIKIVKENNKYYFNINNKLKPLNETIEFKNVYFSYDKKNNIIEDISFKINKNDKVALIGKTGAGKSTIISLLLRFYDVDKGEILIDDINIKDIELSSLRSLFMSLIQDSSLFSETIKYNISYPDLNLDENKIVLGAKKSKAYDFIIKYKDSFDTYLVDSGSNLSLGEKELLLISRCYIYYAPILILDEATSSIDLANEKIIIDSLSELEEKRTSLIIAHRLNTIKNSSLILLLKDKRIIERGTHLELMNKKGEYYNLIKNK